MGRRVSWYTAALRVSLTGGSDPVKLPFAPHAVFFMPPDPRPPARVRNAELMRRLHGDWRECALRDDMHPDTPTMSDALGQLSLHHIHKHPRDDTEANLVMLCGSGTTGCHGLVEMRSGQALWALRRAIAPRVDTWDYLCTKLGGPDAAADWLDRLTRSRTGGEG